MVKGGEVALPSQAVEQHRDKGVERRLLEMRIGKSIVHLPGLSAAAGKSPRLVLHCSHWYAWHGSVLGKEEGLTWE